jgi:hypothetical protein
MAPVELLFTVLGGLAAGLVGALMGLGGGLIAVPFVNLVLGLPMQVAASAGLVSTLATSAVSASRYLRQGGLVQVDVGLELALGAALGSLGGGLASGWLSGPVLQLVFAGVLVFAGASIARQVVHAAGPVLDRAAPSPGRRMLAMALGSGSGVLSGLLGIGGGMLYVPILHLVLWLPFKQASATSNFLMGLIVLPALFGHVHHGHVQIDLVAPLAAGVLVGASLGAWLMPRVRNRFLQIAFGVLLLVTAAELVLKAVGAW